MRSTTNDAANRVQTSTVGRATVRECDDNHLCQEIKYGDTGFSRTHSDFEMWHPLGVTSVPMKQKEQQQQGQQAQQGQQGAEGWNKNQPKGEAAEAMVLYVGGNAAHPVGMINDRRVRPYDMDPGEAAFYAPHDKANKQLLYHRVRGDSNDGLYIVTADDQGGGQQAATGGGGQQQQKRFISIRHANKQDQSRKPQKRQQGAQGGTQAADGGQQQQRHKHEGDSVNTEMRYTSQQMQFYDGSTNVGHYDRGGKDWLHHDGQGATHSMRADKKHSHIKHEGNHIWVDEGNCYSSKPIIIQSDDCS